jgi:hypothetical protein
LTQLSERKKSDANPECQCYGEPELESKKGLEVGSFGRVDPSYQGSTDSTIRYEARKCHEGHSDCNDPEVAGREQPCQHQRAYEPEDPNTQSAEHIDCSPGNCALTNL